MDGQGQGQSEQCALCMKQIQDTASTVNRLYGAINDSGGLRDRLITLESGAKQRDRDIEFRGQQNAELKKDLRLMEAEIRKDMQSGFDHTWAAIDKINAARLSMVLSVGGALLSVFGAAAVAVLSYILATHAQ